MKNKPSNQKDKRLNIRLTDEERKLFEEKASDYPSMSALVIDAVKYFDNKNGANKIRSLNNWGNDFLAYKAEINRIGNNLNQIAHYLNVLNLQNVKVSESILELIAKQLSEWNKIFAEMVNLQAKYTKSVTDV